MMNDPTMLEASLALSDKLLGDGKAPETAITNGFRRIICRQPEKKEIDILLRYWKEQQSYFAANPEAVKKTLQVGVYKTTTESRANLAAMMRVMQVIYNMEEAITKT
jgi:hypothetical protein